MLNESTNRSEIASCNFRHGIEAMTGEIEISLERFYWLSDHAVEAVVLLPGTLYLDLALAAANELNLGTSLELFDIEFHQAQSLDAGRVVRLTLNAVAEANVWSITVSNAGSLLASLKLRATAGRSAALDRLPDPSNFNKANQHALQSSSPTGNAQAFYEQLRLAGNQYGSAFQKLLSLHQSGTTASGACVANGMTPFACRTTTLDAAIQSVAATQSARIGPYLLSAIDSIIVHQNAFPKPSESCHIFATRDTDSDVGGLVGNTTITNSNDEVAVEFRSVQLSFPSVDDNASEIVIAATFTAEPLEDAIRFWNDELNLSVQPSFAPYNQVHQQLLDPASSFYQNADGLNVVMFCWSDWVREHSSTRLQPNRQQQAAIFATHASRRIAPGIEIAHLNPYETDYVFQEIWVDRCYLKHGVSLTGAKCVFDIGANIGLFSLFARQHAPDAQIYSFEPSPRAFVALSANANIYGDDKITPLPCGAGERDESAMFTFYESSSVFSSFHADEDEDQSAVRAIVENMVRQSLGNDADTITIDEAVESFMVDRMKSETLECSLRSVSSIIRESGVTQIDLLKLDAEKSELPVLRGIEDEHWPMIRQVVVEVHDSEGPILTEVQQNLESRGFDVAVEEETLLHGSGLFNLFATRSESRQVAPAAVENKHDSPATTVRKHANELLDNLTTFAAAQQTPLLVISCPAESHSNEFGDSTMLQQEIESQFADRLAALENARFVSSSDTQRLYPVTKPHDRQANTLGHVPFGEAYFTALGTQISRHCRQLQSPPSKVIVVDCDQTLWTGVCGEDGPLGITIDDARRELQLRLLDQSKRGVLLAVCSKNAEEDVNAVFAAREMPLSREDFVGWKVNWQAKSQNLQQLASELNLGLDSFIFIDDNPIECADVATHCPEVLTLQCPTDGADLQKLLDHVWAFDRDAATTEDRNRATMYRDQALRDEALASAPSLQTFIDSLQLEVSISLLDESQIPRAAQLTQRTNQFNFSTIRRTEAEILRLKEENVYVDMIRVKDRFGDYGDVGLLIYKVTDDTLLVETFLLSCRVLGRGCEHQLVAHLGRKAIEHGVEEIRFDFVESAKNQPARDFLNSICPTAIRPHTISAHAAAAIRYEASSVAPGQPTSSQARKNIAAKSSSRDNAKLSHIATQLQTVEQITAALHSRLVCSRPAELGPAIPAKTELESQLASVWCELLRLEEIGVTDSFMQLGGTSLLAVQLVAAIRNRLQLDVAVVQLFERPTIRRLAEYLARNENTSPTNGSCSLTEANGSCVQPASTAGEDQLSQVCPTDIAIVGLAGKFPGAETVDEFWDNLVAGQESIRFFDDDELRAAGLADATIQNPRYVKAAPVLADPALFDAKFFNYSPREAELIDPQQRLFLECCHTALENAGHAPDSFAGRIGVYAGSAMNTYFMFAGLANQFATDYLPTLLASDKDFLATRVSYQLNLTGPSLTIQTACSTSLVAIHTACQNLIHGETDMALAGGVSVRVPHISGHLAEEGSVFSPDGHCRPFDAAAAGTIFGSGVGVTVLKRLADAIADGDSIVAVIKGSAINNDGGGKSDYTAPSIDRQSQAIMAAMERAGVEAETISYIEAHGTGTYLGDPIEIAALTDAHRKQTGQNQYCRIGSVKSNIGHLDAAAGVASLIKTALSIQHGIIPPTINYSKPNPQIGFADSPFVINETLTAWPADRPRRAAINSLGIGGTNAHMILEQSPTTSAVDSPIASSPIDDETHQLLLVSAKSESALAANKAVLSQRLAADSPPDLADAAYTLAVGRNQYPQRSFVVAKSADQAAEQLMAETNNGDPQLLEPDVVFMFPGQGAQHANMARGLYNSEVIFAQQVDVFHEVLQSEFDIDLRGVLFPAEGDEPAANERLRQTQVTQPAIFAVEYSLAKLWMAWGIRPAGVIGHSVGEFAAACIADVLAPLDALRLVARRGKLIADLPAGKMLAVAENESVVKNRISEHLELAAYNSPNACVVSGGSAAVDQLESELSGEGVTCHVLQTSHAFHSDMMTPILDEFRTAVAKVKLRPAKLPVYSTVTGGQADPTKYTDPQFWIDNIRQPVRFSQAAAELLQHSHRVLLEVGPGQTLGSLVQQQPSHGDQHLVLASLRHPKNTSSDHEFLLRTLGRMWQAGIKADWQAFYANQSRRRIPLPTYQFDHERFWLAGAVPPATVKLAPTSIATNDRRSPSEWLYRQAWKPIDVVTHEPFKADKTWLILGDDTTLATAARLQGATVIAVRTGSTYQQSSDDDFIVNATQPEDYRRVLATLNSAEQLPNVIVHTWLASEHLPASRAQAKGLQSLMCLAQAIGTECPMQRIDLHVMTRGVYQVIQDDLAAQAGWKPEPVLAERATVLGACEVIPLEYPNIRCQHIDLPLESGPLSIELVLPRYGHSSVAIRDEAAYVQDFQQINTNDVGDPIRADVRLRDGGTYLLAGGLGGIGLTVAERIAQTANANLVLIARNPPANEQQIIENIAGLGSSAFILSADVTCRKSLAAVIEQTRRQFGQIHGVIHAAGNVDRGGPIQTRNVNDIDNSLAAKTIGAPLLDELVSGPQLDFFIAFSSMATVITSQRIGEIGYLAANAFLDAFSIQRRENQHTFYQTINWDEWRDVGMAADAVKNPSNGGGQTVFDAGDTIAPAEGADIFELALASKASRVAVSVRDLPQRLAQRAGRQLSSSVSLQPASKFRGSNQTKLVVLSDIYSETLGVPNVQPDDDFFDLGGNSLLAIRVNAQIADRLGTQIPWGAILETRTVSKLAELIGDQLPQRQHVLLVPVKESGTKPPLFCLHAAGGSVIFYRQLANHLNEDQPVYGFQSPALAERTDNELTIKQMAARYLEELLEIQPTGPYLLAGYCMGGTIAYELAQQLRSLGKQVDLVATFETYNWIRTKRMKVMTGPRFWLEKTWFLIRNWLCLPSSQRRIFTNEKLNVIRGRQNVWKGRSQRKVAGTKDSNDALLAKLWESNDRAAMQYRPQPYNGKLINFRPLRDHLDLRGCEFEAPNAVVETIECYPAAMMLEPFVQQLANKLTQAIDESVR